MKKILLISVCVVISITAFAQKGSQYITITAGGGLHGLMYNLNEGNNSPGAGATFNVNYQKYFSKNWGIICGIGVQSASSTISLDYTSKQNATDTDGDNYEFRARFSGWKEHQNVLFFEVPVKVFYQYPVNRKLNILASAGIKVLLPFYATYKVKSGQIVTTGYYEQWNVELADMPQHGFTTITDNFEGNISLKTLISAGTEIGAMYRINRNTGFYLGAYFDYGLNNISEKSTKKVYQDDGNYNGIADSDLNQRTSLVNIGINTGIYFDSARWFKTGNRKYIHRK